MAAELAITFPRLGNYHVIIEALARSLFPGQRVFPAPAMTRATVELGSRHSPDTVCAPFKITLGNYIEALEAGANVLLQTGMGCRYGYYGELQEQILRDLGYQFRFVCFSRERARPNRIYRVLRELGCPLSPVGVSREVLLAFTRVRVLDRFEYLLRERLGTTPSPKELEVLHTRLLTELCKKKTVASVLALGRETRSMADYIAPASGISTLRVGIVGELYTAMEPFSNFFLEQSLARSGISVSREMSVSFLLFGKRDRRTLRQTGDYLRYPVGANGIDSVAQCKRYAELGYDGVIHLKSFGCTPELNAMPALARLSRESGMPILHLSFDSHTSETGVETRIEAFCDMIAMKKGKRVV